MSANHHKRATNVSIDERLLKEAKTYKINLSKALEQRLKELLRAYKEAQWLKDNEGAIQYYNEWVNKRGVFSDGIRWKSHGSI